MTGYRYYVGDLRTGRIYRQVDLDGSWAVSIDAAGSVEGTIPLRGTKWRDVRAETAPAKSFLAVSYTDAVGLETFLQAGPIWSTAFDDAKGTLRLGASGLAAYFDHRKVMPVLADGDTGETLVMDAPGAQLGLIAKRLVELSQSHAGGSLPIVLPTDAALGGLGSTVTRTYLGYELAWVGERLRQLSGVDDGPEIVFQPRRRADDPRFLEWVMQIGVLPSMLLTQAGPPWVLDRSVEKSPISSLSVTSDGSSMGFRAWAAGQGEGEGRPIARADDRTLIDAGYPLLEVEARATDTVSETTTLAAHASAVLTESSRPIETWAVSVRRDARPNVGQYRAGDWMTVRVRDHDFLPPDDYKMRLLTYSGSSTSDDVSLALSPRLGAV